VLTGLRSLLVGLRSGAILPASRARAQPTERTAGDPAPRNVAHRTGDGCLGRPSGAGPGAPVRRTCVPVNFAWPSRDAAADASPALRAPLGPFTPWERFCLHHPPTRETTVATSAERMRAQRERERRGIRKFTISVSADDLRVITEHGYEGAASSDQNCRSQAVSRFISDTVACLDSTG
jgi:hypothetical protein